MENLLKLHGIHPIASNRQDFRITRRRAKPFQNLKKKNCIFFLLLLKPVPFDASTGNTTKKVVLKQFVLPSERKQ